MKRLFLAAIFAVGAIATTQAQTQSSFCCYDDQWLTLNVDIERILCLDLQCDPDGWVNYDCPSDFAVEHAFLQGPADPNFIFGVWSNVEWDVSTHTTQTSFTKPNALGNAIPSNRVQFRVFGTANVFDAAVNGVWTTMPFGPGTIADHTSGNVINSADPASALFNMQFKILPLANAWQYTPGVHVLPVHVTLTAD